MAQSLRGSPLPTLFEVADEIAPERAIVVPTLLGREIRQVVSGVRYPTIAGLLISLMILAALTAGEQFDRRLKDQEVVRHRYSEQLQGENGKRKSLDSLAIVFHPSVKPPWPLAAVVDGGEAAAPDVYVQALSAQTIPRLTKSDGDDDDGLSRPAPLDWLFAIRLVLSLGAFILGYDAICGERRRGTLKLLLSYSIPRGRLLLAKFLALAAALSAPFLVGAGASLLLLAVRGVALDPQTLAKAGCVTLLGLAAIVFFSLTALLVSALYREPATSLIVLLLLWVGAAVVIPSLGGLLARGISPVPGKEEVESQVQRINENISRKFPRERHWRSQKSAAHDSYEWEKLSAAADRERRSRQDWLYQQVVNTKLEQARLARDLASLSPTGLLENLAERLTGAGLWREQTFYKQARAFRRPLADFVRIRDARDPDSPHLLFFAGYLSQAPFDPKELPPFTFAERSLSDGIAASGPFLLLLAAEMVLLALATRWVFLRADVG